MSTAARLNTHQPNANLGMGLVVWRQYQCSENRRLNGRLFLFPAEY
jgi:hypothetical protein